MLEQVDFVILSGDIIDPHAAGPFAISFLLDQFRLLDEHQVSVYWAGAREDSPERWPDGIELPDRVFRFPSGRIEQFTHSRGDVELAVITGQSRGDSRRPTRSGCAATDEE